MSNETRWTPPPWRADLIGEEYTVEGMGNPSGSVAVVCSRRSVTGMADAHLIAAAPDGAALAELVMELCGNPKGLSEAQQDELYETALQFMKKARGETS